METPSKDGKIVPMFTPKNSDGSQRVIKQIMVIDPNKLRVAGLDLKMAEALKKSKGNRGKSMVNCTKEDKLAIARSILNKKLKQAKASRDEQQQNLQKEKCDSSKDKPVQKNLQTNVVALKTILSSPRTYVAPSQKQPHAMLVNILENDQRTGSIELKISNKPLVQPEKQAVEQIPKASIKMTKPIKTKNEAPKTIETLVISPEVRFEVKRKSLPSSTKRVSLEPLSNLPKVIESKVLSPEEKIDMKTLCGTSTKPVPATVKIEIKQEIVQRKPSGQTDSVSVKQKPKECVIVCAPIENSEECLPASRTPKKCEVPLPIMKEESAVDFINSLQMNLATKTKTKSKTEPKVEASSVHEDATSFLMSLFGQQSMQTKLSSGLTGKSEIIVKPSVDKPVDNNETNQQQNTAKPEKDSSKQGHRRNVKPVPIIKHKLRHSGTAKIVKDPTTADVVSSDSHPTSKESCKSIKEASSTDLERVCVDLPAAGTALKVGEENSQKISASTENVVSEQLDAIAPFSLIEDKTISRDKDVKSITEVLHAEIEPPNLSSKVEERKALEESNATIIDESEHVEVKSDASAGISDSLKETSSKNAEKVVSDTTDSGTDGVVETSTKCMAKMATKELQPIGSTSSTDREENSLKETHSKGDEKTMPEAVKCDDLSTLREEKNSVKADAPKICKDDVPVEIEKVSLDIPVEPAKTDIIEQPPVQNESESEKEKIDPIKENLRSNEPNVDTGPPTPPPTAATRRKGKKSVPILIAKLNRSRKPASLQEKPKENLKQIAPKVDTSSCSRDESINAQSETEDIATNAKTSSNADEPTNMMEKGDEKETQTNKEEKCVEDGKDSIQTSCLSNKDKENINFEQPTPQEIISQKSLDNQYELETHEKAKRPMETEESEAKQEHVKEICREDNLPLAHSEPTSSKSSHPEAQEQTNPKQDSIDVTKEIDYQSDGKIVSITTTNEETCQQIQKEIATETPTEPMEVTKPCHIIEKQLSSPSKLSVEKENAATSHDMKIPAKKRTSRDKLMFSETEKTAINVTEHPTCVSKDEVNILKGSEVLQTEAKIRPSSRVRKKSSELKEHLSVSSGASSTYLDITDKTKEAESTDKLLIESPKIESPKCKSKRAVSTKKNEPEPHNETLSKNEGSSISHGKDVECEISPFDMLREKELTETNLSEKFTDAKVVKNELSSLLTANSLEKEDTSDGFDHCDNDFIDSFQDDTEIEPTSLVETSSLHEPAKDSVELLCANTPSCEEVDKCLNKSNDDSVFLGFNDKEIEEGQQSTSLRLSQSEDVSPMKSSSQLEAISKKKTTPQVKKSPLSGGKKQKAEQQHWKKNSARTLKNWLKSSDKDSSVKQDDVSELGKAAISPKQCDVEQTSSRGQALDRDVSTLQENVNILASETDAKNSLEVSKEIKTLDDAETKPETCTTPSACGKKKKGKKEDDVFAVKGETRSEKSKRRSTKVEKAIGNLKEPYSNRSNTLKTLEVQSKVTKTNIAAVKDQIKKCKVGNLEEETTVTKSETEEPQSSYMSTKQSIKIGNEPSAESVERNTPSKPTIREKKKKSKKGSLSEKESEIKEESKPVTTSTQKIELDSSNTTLQDYVNNLSSTSKVKLGVDSKKSIKDVTTANPVDMKTPSSAARGQTKRKRGSSKEDVKERKTDPDTPISSATKKTPKSSRMQKRDKTKQLNNNEDLSQPVQTEVDIKESVENLKTSLIESNSRKRKASKCETETPIKVAHISADNDYDFSTPTPRRRGPKKLDKPNTPEPTSTPKSEKKYKNGAEFNPRLLLIRKKEDLKSDTPLVDPSLQMVPKSKDDIQCALCMGYTQKKKWIQHVSEHYGIGWVVGSEPPLNINSRNSVLYYMVEFFKSSRVKGLNCRICSCLRRSALGLLTHIEQCCLTEQEMKESRMECEHCKKEYAKSSMPSHMRSCPELWKKNKVLREPETEPSEKESEKEVALSNTGRLKRKSVIKAEHKFKDMENIEFNPDELIKHIPLPRKDYCVAGWRRDIVTFGKGFCIEKKCEFTAVTVEELQDHCQENVCPFYVQPGYLCMKCKFRADKIELTRNHVLEKHKPKPIEDFKESEDEAVFSSEPSSEEGSSGDEEGSDQTCVVDDNGGEKRKSKKKKRSKKKKIGNTPKQIQPHTNFKKLLPLGRDNIVSEVQRWHQEFLNNNYSAHPLFSYPAPNVTQILDNDIEPYFAKSPMSPKFVLKGFKEPFVEKLGTTSVQPDQWQQLERLNGMADATEHVIYLGGPVKAIAWVPFVTEPPSETQYLASVSRKEFNKFTRFVQPKQSRSLVYIHRYHMNICESQENLTGEIYYALAIDEGPIHCIEFLPSGGYDPEANRLGLLAVGTVKSEIKVYSLPLKVQKGACDIFPILRIEPSFVLSLELEESQDDSSDYYKSQCTSLFWSQFAGHNHIIAGYINGFVSIWDITNDDDNLNRFLVNGVTKFVPVSYFWSKDDRVKRVTAHYDMNGLRWLAVCTAPRRLVFYDIRDVTKPMLILEERTKNDCNSIDWPAVWENPAFAVGDAMPTHGNCVNFISPSALAFVTRRCDKFCSGVTDLHFNPWNNMYAAGSDNGDIQVTPLRETVLDVGFRRKMDEKILTSLDIVAFNGEEISENITQASGLLEMDYKEKYGLVFGPIRQIMGMKTPELYSTKRVPPFILTRLTRVHQLRFNLNQNANNILAVGYANGLVRVLMNKWKDPLRKK